MNLPALVLIFCSISINLFLAVSSSSASTVILNLTPNIEGRNASLAPLSNSSRLPNFSYNVDSGIPVVWSIDFFITFPETIVFSESLGTTKSTIIPFIS
ncbi:hypothetical protein BMS3Abin03_02718 [bacterium BMS3Abin03]|nr:hypothetical protein BMS3Abin03_02718 [bacterium BMS3Abin03]